MTLGLRETQGKTNLKRIQTSLEKAWLSPPHSREFAGLARLELVWSCWASSVPPSEYRQESRWPGPGCVAQCLCRCSRPPEPAGHAGTLVGRSEACRKVIFRLRLRDQRAIMFWARACSCFAKCPPRLPVPACSVPPAPSTETAYHRALFKEKKGIQLFLQVHTKGYVPS